MKMKMLATALFIAVGSVTSAFAQEDPCLTNSSVSHEAVRAGSFKDAYLPWKEVMKSCPTLRYYTYGDGEKILKSLMSKVKKGTPEYDKYFKELMDSYDQLIRVTPEFQTKLKVKSADKVLGDKAIDYIALASKPDNNLAYGWLNQSVNAEKEGSSANVLFYFLQSSMEKLKKDAEHREQFIQDYLTSTQYADAAVATAEKESVKKGYAAIKENLVALFINSGAADCASLQKIYAPKVEANKANLEYLKKVIDIMKMVKCTESDAYFQAAYYAYKIEPTSDAASGCGYMAFKKGDIDGAVKFFEESLNMESDNSKKAEKAYQVAAVLVHAKKLSQAKSFCLKAINFKENYGAPYILIATMYAMSPRWSDEPALNACTYFAVVDKLQRARSVDPSCADEANKLIRTYSAHFPTADKLFFLGLKKGDPVHIGGWIGESTTIR